MKKAVVVLCELLFLGLTACEADRESAAIGSAEDMEDVVTSEAATSSEAAQTEPEMDDITSVDSLGTVTEGTEYYRGFLIDNVFHSVTEGDIHYNVYIPGSYDGSEPYAVYFTLPGYEGLYFQGVATNLQYEEYGFEAQAYNRR